MSVINQDTRLLLREITGKKERFHTLQCLDYGTRVITGTVLPGEAGEASGSRQYVYVCLSGFGKTGKVLCRDRFRISDD